MLPTAYRKVQQAFSTAKFGIEFLNTAKLKRLEALYLARFSFFFSFFFKLSRVEKVTELP